MTLIELMQELRCCNIRFVRSQHGMLMYRCPLGVLTPEITSAIRYHQAALSDVFEQSDTRWLQSRGEGVRELRELMRKESLSNIRDILAGMPLRPSHR